MTAALSGGTEPSLRDRVAEEVRAALGRRRMSGAELARRLNRSQTFVQKRLDGRQAFDVDDIEAVAQVLEISPVQLLGSTPFPSVAPQTTPVGSEGVIRAYPGTTRPRLHVVGSRITSTEQGSAPVPPADAA